MITKILLRLYPAAWRKEYGDEFADVLAAQPLTFRAVANVVWNAAFQLLRYAPLWFLAGMCLLLFTATRMLLQFLGWMSMEEDANLNPVNELLVAQVGLWLSARDNGSFVAGLTGTIKAGLLCKLPVLAVQLLFFATSTFAIDGRPLQVHSRLEALGLFLASVIGSGAVLGCCGGACGIAIRSLRRRFA